MRIVLLAAVLSLSVAAEEDVARRFFRPERYSAGDAGLCSVQPLDDASWIWVKDCENDAGASAERYFRFRRGFRSPGGIARIDVSADERFILLLNGVEIARGPNRGTVENWMYQSYELDIPAGDHLLEAVVWRIGNNAPLAQLSWRGGFVLKANGVFDGLLTTGKAVWRAGELKGTASDRSLPRAGSWGIGYGFRVKGCGIVSEIPEVWGETVVVRPALPEKSVMQSGGRRPGWLLFPSQLEDQMANVVRPGAFRNADVKIGSRFEVAPRTRKELLWDLEDYYCAYPLMCVSGGKGARITWGWSEALRNENGRKSRNRAEWKGKTFLGFTDAFHPDGRNCAMFTTPWWRCGRWVKIVVETADEALAVENISIRETRYPLSDGGMFACDDPTISPIRKLCIRGMQMCAHEMLFDCPFYEQQMYPGDTRVQLRVLASLGNYDSMIRRAAELFDYGRRNCGLVPMNYPSRGLQESVTYSMCHLMMYADYVRYHENMDWLKRRLPGLRHTVDAVAAYENDDGLLVSLSGWNYIDRLPEWSNSVAPDGLSERPSAINNLYWIMTLEGMALVERALGNETMAQLREFQAAKTYASVERLFWDETRGLYADTVKHDSYSEHAQCLALACRRLSPERTEQVFGNLVSDPGLSRCTVYFSYYLFDAYFRFGRGDLFLKHLDLWRGYVGQDLKTPLESPDAINAKKESRSDCHAWGSHPLVFMHKGLAGVDSDALFFRRVRVSPSPGNLKWIKAKTPHPKGFVEIDFSFEGDSVKGTVILPDDVPGRFVWKGNELPLNPGVNRIHQCP